LFRDVKIEYSAIEPVFADGVRNNVPFRTVPNLIVLLGMRFAINGNMPVSRQIYGSAMNGNYLQGKNV
jgi:hypothetical protein